MKQPSRILLAILPLLLLAGGCGGGANQASAAASSQSASDTLRLQGRVTDAANILAADVERRLSARLQRLEEATGHQMVVVTTPSLGGEDIATYTRALGNRRGVGRKDYDDGIIVLIAPQERKTRIAVGYGLEKVLTDAACAEVIRDDMIPHFRKGNFASGVEAAVASLSAKLS
ncbi:TPM domain-containing protein [Novosphingobium mangrovi (ex Huang et al. 2023)]|uniref:TPM domain-containing protein n=1 Tax=Novosphingobium mangrovi (ex Huang et al. 2023) TaxID=2976432 RepID=A0ABT2I7D4_9SPHN|nr:TPM domain-containing protein [Novosphingobium mangrovi (ex Huang et al. 2023)]MCT2400727.1 TPM domain-containing protein [Novosphingobium mangrovi (ex Huang et al. 2023)]